MSSGATLRADPATVMNAIEDAKHEGVPEE
jgi:hypothetical protein